MKRNKRRADELDSLELIEEAVHLVRAAPAGVLALYYLGALPFILGLLYFWADMSRSPFANQHLAEAALGMAVLFLWMKFCQALFLRALRACRAGESTGRLGWRAALGIAVGQAALQPTGLFLLPVALVLVLPFAWMFAFYQNLTALAEPGSKGFRGAIRRSIRQASRWPAQNHLVLLTIFGFGLFVFWNCITVGFLLPGLVKMLFGVESTFTRGGLSMLNTTFFAAMFGLTYLCVDPILKAVYALRCFYGESRESGEDLKAELRQVARSGQIALAVVLLTVAGAWVSGSAEARDASRAGEGASGLPAAQVAPAAPAGTGLSVPELDQTIREVMRQRKYAWRMPREKIAEPAAHDPGILGRFLDRVANLVKDGLKAVGRWLDWLLRKLLPRQSFSLPSGSGYGWITLLYLLIYALAAAAAVSLVILALRVWRARKHRAAAVASEPIQPALDLADENLGPEHLPEDEWTRLGRELLARGELRLALRAFYLGGLASLAARNLISLAKFKSNRDYERELQRRGHAFPPLLTLFGEAVLVFDRAWYGSWAVDNTAVNEFAAKVERIRAGE